MRDPLIILSPPRSFSSVVSTMIGEHPDLYGFPELHLFVGDTVQEVMAHENRNTGRFSGPPGVLRTLAELHDKIQTTGSIVRAAAWLNERRDWTTHRLMNYLIERVDPLIAVEKSPVTCLKPVYLERAYALYPRAYYLHLTRHPLPARKSMSEFFENRHARRADAEKRERTDRLIAWHHMHSNIMQFTSRLPMGQYLRVKGEDILSEPDVFLPQICEWMGVRTDAEAITAMQRPENSPYACIGPDPARGGNDPKFMRSPALRPGRVREPSLDAFFNEETLDWFPSSFKSALEESDLELAPEAEMRDEISQFAHLIGYY